MNISGFNSIGMDAATISKLFAPISVDKSGTTNTSTITPSVSSASSGTNVTSAAIVAIQALVKGGTPASASSADASTTAQGNQSLPEGATATGATTFTPLNSTKSVTMPTDEYLWYKDNGEPQTLDAVKADFYKTHTVASVQTFIDQAKSHGDQSDAAYFTSMQNAIKDGTVKFELLNPSVSAQQTYSVTRDGGGDIIGGSVTGTMDSNAFNNVYNDNSRYYEVGATPFIAGYVTSWSKT
jgi:hypothetical protein